MSGSSDEEDISNGNRDGYQGGGSDGDDDEDEEEDNAIGKKKKQRFGFGKKLVLHQFTKAKNQFRRIRSKKSLLSSSSSSLSTASSSRNVNTSNNNRGKVVIIHGKGGDGDATKRNGSVGCKFCFSRPNVLETPNGSPSSDPNDPKFTQSMLKSLIENNDFYSKECNPHIESLID